MSSEIIYHNNKIKLLLPLFNLKFFISPQHASAALVFLKYVSNENTIHTCLYLSSSKTKPLLNSTSITYFNNIDYKQVFLYKKYYPKTQVFVSQNFSRALLKYNIKKTNILFSNFLLSGILKFSTGVSSLVKSVNTVLPKFFIMRTYLLIKPSNVHAYFIFNKNLLYRLRLNSYIMGKKIPTRANFFRRKTRLTSFSSKKRATSTTLNKGYNSPLMPPYSYFYFTGVISKGFTFKNFVNKSNYLSWPKKLKITYFSRQTFFLGKFLYPTKVSYPLNNFELGYYYSKHGAHFILTNLGLFFPLKFFYKYKSHYLYILKKKVYSFLKTNELKMHIFNSRRRFTLYKVFKQQIGKSLLGRALSQTSRLLFNYFNKPNKQLNYTLYSSKVYSGSPILAPNSPISELGDLRIPRVKFRPGYQRIWRHYRSALMESASYRYTYQKQITKYVITFSRKLHQTYLLQNENLARKLFVYTRLIPDEHTFSIFLSNRLLFVNSVLLLSPKLYLYSGDLLQVEVTLWYYIFSRWLSNCIVRRTSKLARLVFKKSLPTRYKLLKQKKQQSWYTPNWVVSTKFDNIDVKSYLEVDFFTLSAFVVYNHNFVSYHTPDDLRVVRYNIYRNYNWKYIN